MRSTSAARKYVQHLTEGNVELAATYLGHPYIIGGEVIKGDQIGRTIGFPTANLDINFQHKLIPADGVYAGYVRLNGSTTRPWPTSGDALPWGAPDVRWKFTCSILTEISTDNTYILRWAIALETF
jgi:FAD synthase